MAKRVYVYPQLPCSIDLFFFRVGGSGLANCMFIAARAVVLAKKNNWMLIEPTWLKFSAGPYLRREKDKRHYSGLFKRNGIRGFRKCLLISTLKKNEINGSVAKAFDDKKSTIILVQGLGNYFADLLSDQNLVTSYFLSIINNRIQEKIASHDFTRVVGVHIRLGDYSQELRTPISWYQSILQQIEKCYPAQFKFYIFSDGHDEELNEVLGCPNTERFFGGNALADILALSKCCLIIGSDSTFSGWAAFLGQVPIVYARCHYGPVLSDSKRQIILGDNNTLPESYISETLGKLNEGNLYKRDIKY